MKGKRLLIIIPLAIGAGSLLALNHGEKIIGAKAASLTTTVNLDDCTDNQIKSYYSGLNGKSASELQGTNLLKNLKAIISNNVTYYSYGDASKIYTITDRDWKNSPASTLHGTYNSTTKTVTGFDYDDEVDSNPYLHLLYCNYAVKDKTLYKGDGDVNSSQVSFDKEHAWSQSHGFDNGTSSGQNLTGAGSDLHHLKAGTQYGNRTLHSNYSYGYVASNDGDWSSKTYETLNKRGAPLFPHNNDQQAKVFEPQDSDKGDIARALLYMVACYNNYDGSTPTPANPALQLVNYVISGSTTGYSSENITNGYYGVLQDILAWHYQDPVDEYEIHRNNLIYNNYQHNRNPFIDYPEWVDYIWGTSRYDKDNKTISYSSTPTGSVNLVNDVINGYRTAGGKVVSSISVTTQPTKTTYHVGDTFDSTGMVVTATFTDSTTGDVTSNCAFSVDMSTAGTKTVTITCDDKSTTTTITVLANPVVSSITISPSNPSIDLKNGSTINLTVTVTGTNNPDQEAIWSSSNTTVASFNDPSVGVVTCKKAGTVTITAAAKNDTTVTDTCTLTITDTRPSSSTVDQTIAISDYTVATYAQSGNSGSISKTIAATNDLTLNYSGVNTKNSSGTTYTSYLFYTNGAYIYSNNTIAGYYPSRVAVTFDSGVSTNAVCGTTFSSEKMDSANSDISTSAKNNLSYVVTNSDETLLYWNFSIKGYQTRVVSIAITYSSIGGSGGGNIAVTGVSLNRNSLSLSVGNTFQLEATITPNDATNQDVTWDSGDSSVAYVSNSGLVTAQSVGTTDISVCTVDGEFIASCSITVSEAVVTPVQSLEINVNSFATHNSLGTEDAWTVDGISGSGDIGTRTNYINVSTSIAKPIYNITKLTGYITNITVVANSAQTDAKNMGVYVSDTAFTFSGNTPTNGDSSTESLSTSTNISVDYSASSHYRYFAIKALATATYIDSITITYDNTEYVAYTWASTFTTSMGEVCNASGNTNQSSLTEAWNTCKTSYQSLDSSVKTLITNSSNIYDTTYKAAVNAAISSYTYIASKYNSLNQFINGISVNANHNISIVSSKNNNTMIALLILVGVGASIGIVFNHKKKKIEE